MAKTKSTKTKRSSVSSSPNIRLKEANTKDRTPKHRTIAVIAPDDLASGFVEFLRSHAIVALAVGFAVATQVQLVVKQLVSSFITPTFQFFFKGALVNDSVTWHYNRHVVTYAWGIFISDILDLIFVLAILYLVIRIFKLDKLDMPKE